MSDDGSDKLKKAFDSDWRNGGGTQTSQGNYAKAIESVVLSTVPDAMVHRESHSEMVKVDK